MDTPIDITNVVLETPRLILRSWKYSDLDDFFEYASVPEVGPMAGWNPHTEKEFTLKILTSFIETKHTFAIVYKENNKVIGSLGLDPVKSKGYENGPDQGIEFGYVLSKDYWGKGIMPEAVKEAIKYCFETLKLDIIYCGHFTSNNQSRRVIEKCGFTYTHDDMYHTRMNTDVMCKHYVLRRKDYEN